MSAEKSVKKVTTSPLVSQSQQSVVSLQRRIRMLFSKPPQTHRLHAPSRHLLLQSPSFKALLALILSLRPTPLLYTPARTECLKRGRTYAFHKRRPLRFHIGRIRCAHWERGQVYTSESSRIEPPVAVIIAPPAADKPSHTRAINSVRTIRNPTVPTLVPCGGGGCGETSLGPLRDNFTITIAGIGDSRGYRTGLAVNNICFFCGDNTEKRVR